MLLKKLKDLKQERGFLERQLLGSTDQAIPGACYWVETWDEGRAEWKLWYQEPVRFIENMEKLDRCWFEWEHLSELAEYELDGPCKFYLSRSDYGRRILHGWRIWESDD